MIIPKEQLKAEDVRQIVERILQEKLAIEGDGYKCSREQVSAVLVKAAVEGQTIESICADLNLKVASNTIRAHLNEALEACELRQQEVAMNNGLMAGVPSELPKRGCAMAIDYHDEPFYGHLAELRSYACHRRHDPFLPVGDTIRHVATSASDLGVDLCTARRYDVGRRDPTTGTNGASKL